MMLQSLSKMKTGVTRSFFLSLLREWTQRAMKASLSSSPPDVRSSSIDRRSSWVSSTRLVL